MNKIPLIAFALIIAQGFFAAQNHFAEAQMPPQGANNLLEVSTINIKKENISLSKSLPARVVATRMAEIRPQVDGIIVKRKFNEGEIVKTGDELYEIEQTPFRIALQSARTNYQTAKDNLQRLDDLLKESAVSKKEYDDAKTTFARAKAELESAVVELNYSKVFAPISGYISKSNFTEGNLVAANQAEALTTITQLSPIFVDIVLPSKDYKKFKSQDDLAVALEVDGNAYAETGILKFVEVFVNESTDSVTLRAEFQNVDGILLPGMFVKAKLQMPEFAAVTIPQRATIRNPDGSLTAWVLDKDQKAHMRKLTTNGIFENSWIVKEGLEQGDLAVFEGYQRLAEGMKVKAVNATN